jgi:hypothetical protein
MAYADLSLVEQDELRELVLRYRVTYDIRPAHTALPDRLLTIGYDVELLGTHPPGSRVLAPGCPLCVEVWRALRRIALAVLPSDTHRISRYELEPFDRALHMDMGARDHREDVVLPVEVRHKEGYNEPADVCEERCLHEITADLRALGVQSGRWREPDARPPAP